MSEDYFIVLNCFSGIHTLELAKTFWNAFVTAQVSRGAVDAVNRELLISAKAYLSIASCILCNFGPEGDPGGPLGEIDSLERLVAEEESDRR
jgi:hypothetical protein